MTPINWEEIKTLPEPERSKRLGAVKAQLAKRDCAGNVWSQLAQNTLNRLSVERATHSPDQFQGYLGDLSRIPGKITDGGCIYVLRYDFGALKIGMTSNPYQRFGQLTYEARRMWRSVTDYWLSMPAYDAERWEVQLKHEANETSSEVRAKEYFMGCSFDALVVRGRYFVAQDELYKESA